MITLSILVIVLAGTHVYLDKMEIGPDTSPSEADTIELLVDVRGYLELVFYLAVVVSIAYIGVKTVKI